MEREPFDPGGAEREPFDPGGAEREPFDPAEFERTVGAVPWVRRVACHREIDSTNAEALRLAGAGAPEGTVVVADSQTAGRGRLGRAWWSEPGAGLLASWLLRPSLVPEAWPLLSLVTGIAAARSVTAGTGLEVRLKWPNDLIVGDRKLAGILAESDGRGALVIGIGLNVRRRAFPKDIRETATSVLAAGGRPAGRPWLLAATLSGFGARMASPADSLDEYRSLSATLGREVRVERTAAGPVVGLAQGVDESGALLVETAAGTVRVAAGEVKHVR